MSSVEFRFGDKVEHFNIIESTRGPKGIDISKLKKKTGFVTFDPGYQNTSSFQSTITHTNGNTGELRYRGYNIEDLAEKSSFVETAYLLVYGKLPNQDELSWFSNRLNENSVIHEDMKHFFYNIPLKAHPMPILSSMITNLSLFYPDVFDLEAVKQRESLMDLTICRLISQIRTIAAFAYKKAIGEPFVYPKRDLSYCANFLNMMFDSPVKNYVLSDELIKIMNVMLIVHADHGQNCSTSTVRLVGSSRVNLYASIAAAIFALWGPLHGGANQGVIEMLQEMRQKGISSKKFIEKAKDRNSQFKLMGFGHRVYKTYDPRAKIIKKICLDYVKRISGNDPLLDIALELEEQALNDDFFKERNLFPNVDFYSGIVYRALGIPSKMFTVMFAIGRLPGWIAHWKELQRTRPFKIGRPSQVYTGEEEAHYTPIDQR